MEEQSTHQKVTSYSNICRINGLIQGNLKCENTKAILSQVSHSCEKGAETRWFVNVVTCNTPLTSVTPLGNAKGCDIVQGVGKLTQT